MVRKVVDVSGVVTGNSIVASTIYKAADRNDHNARDPNKVLAYQDERGRIYTTHQEAMESAGDRTVGYGNGDLVVNGVLTDGRYCLKEITEVWIDRALLPKQGLVDTAGELIAEVTEESDSERSSHGKDYGKGQEVDEEPRSEANEEGEMGTTTATASHNGVTTRFGNRVAQWLGVR